MTGLIALIPNWLKFSFAALVAAHFVGRYTGNGVD